MINNHYHQMATGFQDGQNTLCPEPILPTLEPVPYKAVFPISPAAIFARRMIFPSRPLACSDAPQKHQ